MSVRPLKRTVVVWGCAAVMLGLLALAGPAAAAEDRSAAARTFLEGVEAYRQGAYGAAGAAFRTLADAGVRNPHLYYNLGNACLKSGDLGPAILWYERALKLAPDDPDLTFNHAYATSLVKDEREDASAAIYRILFFWRRLLSPRAAAAAALIFNGLFWLVLTVRFLRRKQRALKGVAYPLLAAALIFTATALYNYYEAAWLREGIVLPGTISVRSGLSEDATELFVLHAGAKVAIQGQKEGFYRICFSEGKIGWVKGSEIGAI
mgnify:CR=1 FL=1